jgi:hypothetical protein
MDTGPDEPRSLDEKLDLPEQLDDDGAVPAGGPLRFARMTGSSIAGLTPLPGSRTSSTPPTTAGRSGTARLTICGWRSRS